MKQVLTPLAELERSALPATGVDLAACSGSEVNDALRALTRVREAVQVATDRALQAQAERCSWAIDGALDHARWLDAFCDTGRCAARGMLRDVEAWAAMPHVGAALGERRVSRLVARRLRDARDVLSAAFADAEEFLVGAVEGLGRRDAYRVIDTWMVRARQAAESLDDHESPTEPELTPWIGLRELPGGWLGIQGELAGDGAQAARTVLENLAANDDSDRPWRQKLGDALVRLCRQPVDGGFGTSAQRPHIVAIINAAQVVGGAIRRRHPDDRSRRVGPQP